MSDADIEWRPVPSYPGLEVTRTGRVRYAVPYGRRREPGELSVFNVNQPSGCPLVMIYKPEHGLDAASVPRAVHLLVAEAFIGPRPAGMEVDHVYGNKSNFHVSNLEYVTRSENMRRAWARRRAAQGVPDPAPRKERAPRVAMRCECGHARSMHSLGRCKGSMCRCREFVAVGPVIHWWEWHSTKRTEEGSVP